LDREDIINLIQNKVSAVTGSKLRMEPFHDFSVYTGAVKWIMTYKIGLSSQLVVSTMAISQMGDFIVIAGERNLAVWA